LLPEAFRTQFVLPEGWTSATSPAEADAALTFTPDNPVATWVFALVAAFPTLVDDVSGEELRAFWQLGAEFPAAGLLLDATTQAALISSWGAPQCPVRVLPAADLLDAAWADLTAWAIIPFEDIQPRWKVLSLDGHSPLRKDFSPRDYALSFSISLLTADPALAAALAGSPGLSLPETNRDPALLTTVILTGVTALVRATASEMEYYGVTHPAEFIGPTLAAADITHVSNEIPFDKKCPHPKDNTSPDLVFCSRDKYLELLQVVGTDVVELTGDHFQDWGAPAMLHTLDLYQALGWPYYGGGANLEEARQPVLFEHNGNKIAFLGCNAKPPGYAQASEQLPGAYHCDMAYMAAEVQRLRAAGYMPIVTFQHEEFYEWIARPSLVEDFHRMAEAGAVIVSGSQAHQPHGMEFYGGAMLRYGLGNLFFDQYTWCDACDEAFIDRHVFYNGQYLGVELLSIQFVDYSRPRWMTPEERQQLLEKTFQASGWLEADGQ
ncbi:MAG TPA: CapA family protein, partial [Anaerolineaceae bacterium]|nr:CapA family protein [Anaerolineaceae bacterium]